MHGVGNPQEEISGGGGGRGRNVYLLAQNTKDLDKHYSKQTILGNCSFVIWVTKPQYQLLQVFPRKIEKLAGGGTTKSGGGVKIFYVGAVVRDLRVVFQEANSKC